MTARLLGLLILVTLLPVQASAQEQEREPDATPAFTLSSSETFTTRDHPSFNLTFRHISHLDFRVYKVRDAFAFFAALRDPHQLGSEERPVAQERSWIERLADWKRQQRQTVRSFFRNQVSSEYRSQRRAARDRSHRCRCSTPINSSRRGASCCPIIASRNTAACRST
jgi:hypothetical protein